MRSISPVFMRGCILGLSALAWPVQAADRAGALDFSGVWARTTFGLEQPASGPGPVRTLGLRGEGGSNFNVADENSPILKPAAAAAVKLRNQMEAAGTDYPTASNQCMPMAAPYIFRVQQMEVLQGKDEILLMYMQDHQVRHVRLNSSHPARLVPSWYGDSIGHYEGDALVVDTVGFKVGRVAQVDVFGSPYSEALHVVERYRLIDYEAAKAAQERNVRENGPVATEQAAGIDPNYRGKGLQVEFTVEDRNFFTMPWSGAATYRRAGAEWVENVCAENIHEYYLGRDTAIPQADRPDF